MQSQPIEHILNPDELRRMQLIELEILLEADRICRKHNLHYFMAGGTLLGAVRHGGFIPWDDDIDIWMPRADYTRFLELCDAELNPDKFFLQCREHERTYRWGFSRIRRKDTAYISLGHEHLSYRTGMFIDILPYDNVADGALARRFQKWFAGRMRRALWSCVGKRKHKNAFMRGVYAFVDLFPTRWYINAHDWISTRYNGRKTALMNTFSHGFSPPEYGFENSWTDTLQDMAFEGYLFKAPTGTHEYLEAEFRDYMTPPPPEAQRGNSPSSRIEFGDVVAELPPKPTAKEADA